jgi:hypothetical protein
MNNDFYHHETEIKLCYNYFMFFQNFSEKPLMFTLFLVNIHNEIIISSNFFNIYMQTKIHLQLSGL